MYNSDLEELIAFYEEEKQNLERLIKECVDEMEYQLAEYHFHALGFVNQKLQIFQNLTDPQFDKKYSLKMSISFYQKEYEKATNEKMKEFYFQRIKETASIIENLNTDVNKIERVGSEFDNLLYDIAEGLIKGFRFNLHKEQNLYLDFIRIKESTLLLSFTSFDKLPEFVFYEETHVYALGFYLNKEQNRLEYKYNLSKFRDTRFIKTLISKIIFEVFYYKQFDNPTAIEIFTERTSE